MQFGKLTFNPLANEPELVAKPIQAKLKQGAFQDAVYIATINPDQADTGTFCEEYGIDLESSANCIIVEAKRADKTWHAACLVLADNMIDVNGKVRRYLDARKVSFASRDTALELTGMEYGGITPLGLPDDLPILIDKKVTAQEYIIIGSGLRDSKILINPKVLTELNRAEVIDITK